MQFTNGDVSSLGSFPFSWFTTTFPPVTLQVPRKPFESSLVA